MAQKPPAATPLELTRRSFKAAGSGDYDLMMSFYGRDSVFDMSDWGLGVHSGEARIRTFFEQWIGAFAEFEMELEEARDLGGGVVFAVALQEARDVRSLSHLRLRHAAIAVWEDGVAIRVTNYRDIDKARALADIVAKSVT
jgi:ketosteroid isomerase-like protein